MVVSQFIVHSFGSGADDTLPLLIAAVIEAAPPNLHTTLFYLQNFIFAKIATSALGYHLVNLQAAIQFVRGEEEKKEEMEKEVDVSPHDPTTDQHWQTVHSLADNYRNNRYSTSYVASDHRTKAENRKTIQGIPPPSIPFPLCLFKIFVIGDEILQYLTQGVSDSTSFTPHRYTSSVRSTSSMNLAEHMGDHSSDYNSNSRNNAPYNYHTYSGRASSDYKSLKALASNPLTNDNFQDWIGACMLL